MPALSSEMMSILVPGTSSIMCDQIPGKHPAFHQKRGRHAYGALPTLQQPGARDGLVGKPHESDRVPMQRLARLGKLHAAPPALEQDDVQALLQKVYLLYQRRRGDIERPGRLAEAARVGHLDERLYLARIHCSSCLRQVFT